MRSNGLPKERKVPLGHEVAGFIMGAALIGFGAPALILTREKETVVKVTRICYVFSLKSEKSSNGVEYKVPVDPICTEIEGDLK